MNKLWIPLVGTGFPDEITLPYVQSKVHWQLQDEEGKPLNMVIRLSHVGRYKTGHRLELPAVPKGAKYALFVEEHG